MDMSEHRFLMSLKAALPAATTMGLTGGREKLAGINNLLNEDVASRGHEPEPAKTSVSAQFDCDVLVVAPLILELRMAALAFGCAFDTPTGHHNGLPYFELVLDRRAGLKPIQVRLATLNRQTNVRSGPRTSSLLLRHQPKVAILTGIAGAREDQVLGRVSAFETVTYVAGGVEVPDGKEPQNQLVEVSEVVFNLLHSYADLRSQSSIDIRFAERLQKAILEIDGDKPEASKLASFVPKFSVKTLMSGETLRKDGGFTEQAAELDRRMTMVEMEAAGFAYACKERNVDWAVFRGSCDYANLVKDDVWQRVAALNCGLTVCDCLQSAFRTDGEINY
jgi:nucleoside phosphorylase